MVSDGLSQMDCLSQSLESEIINLRFKRLTISDGLYQMGYFRWVISDGFSDGLSQMDCLRWIVSD